MQLLKNNLLLCKQHMYIPEATPILTVEENNLSVILHGQEPGKGTWGRLAIAVSPAKHITFNGLLDYKRLHQIIVIVLANFNWPHHYNPDSVPQKYYLIFPIKLNSGSFDNAFEQFVAVAFFWQIDESFEETLSLDQGPQTFRKLSKVHLWGFVSVIAKLELACDIVYLGFDI